MQNSDSIILFDGVCNLCNNSVQFIIRNDKKKKFKFAPLQSLAAQKILQLQNKSELSIDSIILVEKNEFFFESTAALRIAKQLQFPIWILSVFILIPKFIRDAIYKWLAKNRYRWFGKRESCMVSTPELRARFLDMN